MSERNAGMSGDGKTVSQVGEEGIVALLVGGLESGGDVLVGPGDDCAVVRVRDGEPLMLKADCVLEGVHFLRDHPPFRVGWKALARAISDFAAMAGTPRFALTTLALPSGLPMGWVAGFNRGMRSAARRFGVRIVGGETARSRSGIFINISMAGGAAPGPILRSGAEPGDAIFVTGRLGGSFESGWHLRFLPRLCEACWLARNFRPSAMMDLSDGLAADLPRLAAASGVAFRIDGSLVPRRRGFSLERAAGDGEDFELLFTIPENVAPMLERRWRTAFPRLALTRIGAVAPRGRGEPAPWEAAGFEHFGRRAR